jgi:hypothetical protein
MIAYSHPLLPCVVRVILRDGPILAHGLRILEDEKVHGLPCFQTYLH